VSLLVNHKFWGERDSQHVLVALGRDLPDDGQDMAQLFQRALLPTGIEGTLQTEDKKEDVDKDGARLDPADVRVPHWVKEPDPEDHRTPDHKLSSSADAQLEDCLGMYAGHVVANLRAGSEDGSLKSDSEYSDEEESESEYTEEEEAAEDFLKPQAEQGAKGDGTRSSLTPRHVNFQDRSLRFSALQTGLEGKEGHSPKPGGGGAPRKQRDSELIKRKRSAEWVKRKSVAEGATSLSVLPMPELLDA
jgi:hypothetical protein